MANPVDGGEETIMGENEFRRQAAALKEPALAI